MLASATACFAKTGSSPLRLAILHLADGRLSCRLGERGVVVEEREASSRRQGRKSGSKETRRLRKADSNPPSLLGVRTCPHLRGRRAPTALTAGRVREFR